jgi:hypothetical protein
MLLLVFVVVVLIVLYTDLLDAGAAEGIDPEAGRVPERRGRGGAGGGGVEGGGTPVLVVVGGSDGARRGQGEADGKG